MSDRDKGYYGDYVENSHSNIQYQLGAQDARMQKEAEDRNRINETYEYGGYSGGGTPMSPQAARLVAKIFFIIVFMGLIAFLVAMTMASVNEKEQMDAVAAQKAKVIAAEAAHQQKLALNREPLHFHGYTLYSDTSPASRYLSFRITNAAGKVIWTQPAGMDDKMVSESRPMADVTAKYYLHPGQVKFMILANGANGNLYMYTVCIGRDGQITWASPYHAPYKNQWRYHPAPVVLLPH